MKGSTALEILVSLAGVGMCIAALGLLWYGSSIAADARTANLNGAGVDVHVIDRWPAPGERMRIEVEAHGGDRTGVHTIRVRDRNGTLIERRGEGITWGFMVQGSRSRAESTHLVEVPIPRDARPGEPLELYVDVHYTCAMARGGSFDNEPFEDDVLLVVVPRVGTDALVSRALAALRALGALAAWMLLCGGAVRAMRGRSDRAGRAAGEALGAAAVVGFVGAGIVGYWTFAFPLASVLGGFSGLDYGLAAVFLAAGPIGGWLYARNHRPLEPVQLRLASSAEEGPKTYRDIGSPPEASLESIAAALLEGGFTVKRSPGRIDAKKDRRRLRVIADDRFTDPDAIQVHTDDAFLAIHVAVAIARQLGAVELLAGSLHWERVEKHHTVADVQQRILERMVRHGQAMLDRLQRITPKR